MHVRLNRAPTPPSRHLPAGSRAEVAMGKEHLWMKTKMLLLPIEEGNSYISLGKVYKVESSLGTLLSGLLSGLMPAIHDSSGGESLHISGMQLYNMAALPPNSRSQHPASGIMGLRQMSTKNVIIIKIIADTIYGEFTKAICLTCIISIKPHNNLMRWKLLSPVGR